MREKSRGRERERERGMQWEKLEIAERQVAFDEEEEEEEEKRTERVLFGGENIS